jgi:hypothetical protein
MAEALALVVAQCRMEDMSSSWWGRRGGGVLSGPFTLGWVLKRHDNYHSPVLRGVHTMFCCR